MPFKSPPILRLCINAESKNKRHIYVCYTIVAVFAIGKCICTRSRRKSRTGRVPIPSRKIEKDSRKANMRKSALHEPYEPYTYYTPTHTHIFAIYANMRMQPLFTNFRITIRIHDRRQPISVTSFDSSECTSISYDSITITWKYRNLNVKIR